MCLIKTKKINKINLLCGIFPGHSGRTKEHLKMTSKWASLPTYLLKVALRLPPQGLICLVSFETAVHLQWYWLFYLNLTVMCIPTSIHPNDICWVSATCAVLGKYQAEGLTALPARSPRALCSAGESNTVTHCPWITDSGVRHGSTASHWVILISSLLPEGINIPEYNYLEKFQERLNINISWNYFYMIPKLCVFNPLPY